MFFTADTPRKMWVFGDNMFESGRAAHYWTTRDGGAQWDSVAEELPGAPGPRYVSDIEPCPHRRRTVYVTLDGHRSDDYAAHVFVSRDAGASWSSIASNLPEVPVRTIAAACRSGASG